MESRMPELLLVFYLSEDLGTNDGQSDRYRYKQTKGAVEFRSDSM